MKNYVFMKIIIKNSNFFFVFNGLNVFLKSIWRRWVEENYFVKWFSRIIIKILRVLGYYKIYF